MTGTVQIIIGDAIEQLATLPACSVHCCVTSPPYFGLRDYGHAGQIGLEESPEAYVAKLVDVFREVRRVLRDDGTLWLNLGDSYNNSGLKDARKVGGFTGERIRNLSNRLETGKGNKGVMGSHARNPVSGLDTKQLLGIPWRVAFALQSDGWILRQDIIWHKPNPMPESVKDRCTKAHEYLFLFAKSKRYWFDSEAMKEESNGWTIGGAKTRGKTGYAIASGATSTPQRDSHGGLGGDGTTRNRRSVWSICPRPYKGAHFATFPPQLIEPCILAGCPENGTVLDPFGGSGTTGLVAKSLFRNAILIELNPAYQSLIERRIHS